MISIFQATKSLNIKDFIYVKPSAYTVLNKDNNDFNKFISVQVKDLINGITNNIQTNNLKGNILLYSHRAFRTGILFIGILGVLITFFFTINKKSQKPIISDSPAFIRNINERISKFEESLERIDQELTTYSIEGIILKDSMRIRNLKMELDSLKNQIELLKQQQVQMKTDGTSAKRK